MCLLLDLFSVNIKFQNVGGVLLSELVLVLALLEILGGVDEEDVAGHVAAVLLEDHDDGRDGRVVEEVGGQPDDGVDGAVVDQLLADRAFGGAAEEDAMREDDAHRSVFLEVVEAVEQEGVVRLGLRGKGAVGAESRRVEEAGLGGPFGGVGRVHDHAVEVGLLLGRPVGVQRVAVVEVLMLQGDAVDHHVHLGKVVGRGVELLAPVVDGLLLVRVSADVQ